YSRSGIVIYIKTSSGMFGYGETAPLPFFHKESLEEAVLQLKDIKKTILRRNLKEKSSLEEIISCNRHNLLNLKSVMHRNIELVDLIKNFNNHFFKKIPFLSDIFSDKHIFPSVRSGIEMALLNMFFLNEDFKKYISHTEKKELPVCGLITDLKTDVVDEVNGIVKKGYKSIKIKVGRRSMDCETEKIIKIKNFIKNCGNDNITLRLDANGLWNLEEAVYFGKQVGSSGIEYIEDPVDDLNKYLEFFDKTNIPVAFDEKLGDFLKSYDKSENFPAYLKALVLKPGFIVSFSKISDLIAVTGRTGIITVLSNSFESNLAIASIASFAYLMDLTGIPMGLGTLDLFKSNLLSEDIKIKDGKIILSEILENIGKINFDMLQLLK
ncbi:MAG: o-succinylbenzoate synthase, partial [Actinomycetota bacterium]|nr:o-succinylbenzoate synthase [Actinomycetota bacterium]